MVHLPTFLDRQWTRVTLWRAVPGSMSVTSQPKRRESQKHDAWKTGHGPKLTCIADVRINKQFLQKSRSFLNRPYYKLYVQNITFYMLLIRVNSYEFSSFRNWLFFPACFVISGLWRTRVCGKFQDDLPDLHGGGYEADPGVRGGDGPGGKQRGVLPEGWHMDQAKPVLSA